MMFFGLFPLLALALFILFARGVGGLLSRSGRRNSSSYGVNGLMGCGSAAGASAEVGESNEPSEAKIFKLADQNSGVLTLSDVVVGLGYGVKESERLMDGLIDGLRVRLEVGDDGNVRYEFPELIHRRISSSPS